MRIKSIIVVLLASISVGAHAQTPSGAPTDAQQAKPSGSFRATSVDQPQPAAQPQPQAVGWNFVHANACQPIYDGTSVYLYIFAAEGGILSTNFPPFVNTLLPACQSGNLIGFYVTDASGSWSSLLVYSHK
jgi:hypothetical protein